MKNPNMYLHSSIDDIIFEDRNQAYGAYQLRKDSSRFLAISLFIGLFLVSIFSAYSLSRSAPEILKKEIVVDIKKIINDLPKQPDLPTIKENLPTPPVEQTVSKASIAFNEMVITNDDKKLTDDIPTIEDLKGKQISNVTNDTIDSGDIPILNSAGIKNPIAVKEDYILFPQQDAEYVGGYLAMHKWLYKNIDYPTNAMKRGIKGTVHVSFIIEKDGSISNVEVVRGVSVECDEEAVRAISEMQNWIPGKQNGNPVRVKKVIPIKFELED